MARIDWMKCTTATASGLKNHLDNEARITHEHDNPDINTDLTYRNYYIGANDFKDGIDKLKERIETVDKQIPPERIRADRKTCVMLEVPCPDKIREAGESDRFFSEMHKLYESFFGKENVMYTAVHKDETHKYRDAKTGKMRVSLEHSHTLVAAYTPEKGINGHTFFVRDRYKALNDAADAMCFREFGIHLNTGEHPGNERVEKLKIDSEIKAAEHEARKTIQEIDEKIAAKQKELTAVEEQYVAASSELKLVLDTKAEAAAIRKAGKVIVDEKMAAGLTQIGEKVQQNLRQIRELSSASITDKYEISIQKQRLGERESILSEREKELEYDRKNFDQHVREEAKKIATEAFHGIKSSREERLEKLCSSLRMSDGRTALERFYDDERVREEEIKDEISESHGEERPE